MQIAFLNPQGNFDQHDSYWAEHPDFGGQLVYVKEVAAALGKLGHQVDIITRRISDPDWPEFVSQEDRYPEIPNVRILRFGCGPQEFLRKEMLWPYLVTEWVPGIIDFYKKNRYPDVFSAHYGDGGLAGAGILYETGIPYTFTAHSLGAQKLEKLYVEGSQLDELEKRYHFSTRIYAERVSIENAGRIITSTRQERDIQYRHPAYRSVSAGESETKFRVIPPGVNTKVFSRHKNEMDQIIGERIRDFTQQALPESRRDLPAVISASRLERKKNITGVIRAFAINKDLRTRGNLMIIVRAPLEGFQQESFLQSSGSQYAEEIYSMIKSNGLEENIIVVPINGQDELAAAYRFLSIRRSVFVLAAIYEPFGLAPLEAMASGIPVVVTRNGGPAESLVESDEEFGILVDPLSAEGIGEGLLRLLASQAEWEKYQKAGARRVLERYTWDNTAKGYQRVFNELVNQHIGSTANRCTPIPEYFLDPEKFPSGPHLSFDWLKR